MTYEGCVRNGTVVWTGDARPPEGSRVRVEVVRPSEMSDDVPPSTLPAGEGIGQALLKFAGKAKGLPRDASAQHDHYLYGTPKQS